MPESPAGRSFLDAVRLHLRLDPDAEADVLDELSTHLADSADRHAADGRSREDAEREAVRRLGDPLKLARDIRRAHRTRRRLLAAAGGGVLGAADGAVRGMVPAIGVIIGSSLVGLILTAMVLAMLGRHISVWSDALGPSGALVLATFLGFGAARRTVWAIARGAHWPLRGSKAVTAITGIVAISGWCVVGPPVALTVGTIVAEVGLIAAWIVGVASTGHLADVAFSRRRLAVASLAFGLVLCTQWAMTSSRSGVDFYEGPEPDLSRIGAWAEAGTHPYNVSSNPDPAAAGRYVVSLETFDTPVDPDAQDTPATALWSDGRIELWAAVRRDVDSPFAEDIVGDLDATASGPVRTVPLVADGSAWTGSIRFDDVRDLNQAWVVVTAQRGDARVIFAAEPVLAVYRANLADWLGSFAPGSGHAVPRA